MSPGPPDEVLVAAHPFAAAHAGIVLREEGRVDEAEDVFLRLIRKHPGAVYGWQELAILYARAGKSAKALYLFRKAIAAAPHDLQPRIHCAMHMMAHGRAFEADQVLAAHQPGSVAEARRSCSIREFLIYLRRWPIGRALALSRELVRGPHAADLAEVETRILDAIRNSRPFALIRLGDGEGAWTVVDERDEADYPALHADNRRGILRVWFGDETLIDDPGFASTLASLKRAANEADILGIPMPSRIEGEYALRSARGYSCNLNLLRWLQAAAAPGRYCSQDVHLQLQSDGFYPRLFRAASRVGVITCHPRLSSHIAERTGAPVLAQHLIPEEKGFSDVIGPNGIGAPHFPTVFEGVMRDLGSRSQAGMLWIVAAGVLGKLYCAQIRRQGGCALDLGSIVDGWLGKITRPTLRKIEEFAL